MTVVELIEELNKYAPTALVSAKSVFTKHEHGIDTVEEGDGSILLIVNDVPPSAAPQAV